MKHPPPKPDAFPFRRLRKIVEQSPKIVRRMVAQYATNVLADFKDAIMRQDFEAFRRLPLSAKWLATKARHNADLRTMLATHHYINSIQIHVQENKDGSTTYYIGFDPDLHAINLKHEPVPIKLIEVARIQEHGSAAANIPPRPHWGPTRTRIQMQAPQTIKRMRKSLIEQLRLMFNEG
jgi:hypothetical protein